MILSIVPAEDRHVAEICRNMRTQEATEIVRLGRDPQSMIRHELATSMSTYAAVLDDEVIVLGGIKCPDFFSDEAYVWIICSEAMARHSIAFVRRVLELFDNAKARYDSIWGFVVTDFTRSVRWVEWLGFTVEPPVNGVALFWWGKRPNIDLGSAHGH